MSNGNGNQPDPTTPVGNYVVGTDIETLRAFIDAHARRQFDDTKVVFVETDREDGSIELVLYQVPPHMTDYDAAVAYARQQMGGNDGTSKRLR